MMEIYFLNNYFVRASSWHNAAKSWLKYHGDATDIACKAIDAMDNLNDIFKMLNVFASEIIERAGIAKEYYYFEGYCDVNDEDFYIGEYDNVNYS